ncbi:MAG: DUF5683 domain-containing protein [Flammeovirgaceae bacterium]|nr:DUF5683 domain-containing protein [Flammeovirgaceae bacterium]
MKAFILTFSLLLSLSCQLVSAQAQEDSIRVIRENDTIQIKSYAERFNPRKALLYAAVLPGSGQIYNKKYWKLPLVYGGIFAIGYAINFYQDGFSKYKGELFYVLNQGGGVSPSGYNESNLRTIVDRYRRERDFWIVMMAGMYLLQIVDAHVDAHLKEFDLNPNLKVQLKPTWEQDELIGRQSGFSIVLKF